jgi:hypothetical protein
MVFVFMISPFFIGQDVSVTFPGSKRIDVFGINLHCNSAVLFCDYHSRNVSDGILLHNRRSEHVSIGGSSFGQSVLMLTCNAGDTVQVRLLGDGQFLT